MASLKNDRNNITVESLSKKIQKLQGRLDWHSVICDVFEISAIVISNQIDLRKDVYEAREERYKTLVKKYSEDGMKLLQEIFGDLYILLSKPAFEELPFSDFLGELYMYSGTSNKGSGQFFTPYCVSKLMAQMTYTKERVEEVLSKSPNHIIKINEPSCGSGGMILASIEQLRSLGVNYANDVIVIANDIDKRCVHMAYLQLALAGIPAIIYHQNTLTLETWDEWRTPAYIFNFMHFDKALKEENK